MCWPICGNVFEFLFLNQKYYISFKSPKNSVIKRGAFWLILMIFCSIFCFRFWREKNGNNYCTMFIDVDDDILVQNWNIQNFFLLSKEQKKIRIHLKLQVIPGQGVDTLVYLYCWLLCTMVEFIISNCLEISRGGHSGFFSSYRANLSVKLETR